jgi:UDP-N-acetylglucosamine--N-acetylmuramyl-(pentapeptide) pyrophosphoryl-undecaprenol N-acetylglucosamine transferase
MKILFAGGGTMGSVSPLLALHEEMKSREIPLEVLWVATQEGPERSILQQEGIRVETLPTAKFRRYLSHKNITDFFNLVQAHRKARKILQEFEPDIILTAGSFVAYPVTRAGAKLGIPYVIHQQDIEKGLANKLMEKGAALITITYDQSLNDFDFSKTQYTSNPFRKKTLECDPTGYLESIGLDSSVPTILIMGGGLGAQAINLLTRDALKGLTQKYQVLHITGAGKSIATEIEDAYTREEERAIHQRYRAFEFVTDDMCKLLRVADLVVTRAGISSLTELSVLGKPTIIIPIPDSHQEANAAYYDKYNAAIVLDQKTITGESFVREIEKILGSEAHMNLLKKNIRAMIDDTAAKRYVDLIVAYLAKR